MSQITLPLYKTRAGGSLFDIANELSRSSDDGYGKSAIADTNLVFTGLYSNYLTHDVIVKIIAEGGEILDNLMYGTMPVQSLAMEIPEGLETRLMKLPGGAFQAKVFNQWADSHIKVMYDAEFTKFYTTSNPIQFKPLKGSELVLLINDLGATLLTIAEYNNIKDTLV